MVENEKKIKVFLATGGSGGHIFPAISIAEKLTSENNNICIIADDIYEKYSSCNLNYRIIKAGKSIKSFSSVKQIIFGFFQALKLIKTEKPDLIVGFGSYATLPTLMACILTKTKFIIHEQNAYIGKINKLFAKYAITVMTTYHELYGINFRDMEKIVYTGSPVRENIKQLKNTKYNYPKDNDEFVVLITGGSAGASIFSEYLPKIFDENHKKEQKKLKIYHQVREEFLDQTKEYYKKINLNAVVQPFFSDIEELLSKAHLVIGRAGSGTLCETAIAGKPSILIPLPNRSNNRQEVNADNFAKNGAGVVVIEKDFTIKDFQTIFFDLIKDKKRLEDMSINAKNLAVVEADENIVNVIHETLQD